MSEQGEKIAVFAYNFPHKKTQDFIFRLMIEGFTPRIVLAADPVVLDIPKPTIRYKPKHSDLVSPRLICEKFNIEFVVVDHNSKYCQDALRSLDIQIGLISGARILNKEIIDRVPKGIINIHPGLLPEVRGLDALLWSVYEGHPLGVTAHAINEKIDHGHIITKQVIPEYSDDSLIDLSLRLEQTQTSIVGEAIRKLSGTPLKELEVVSGNYKLHHKMPPDLENLIPSLLEMRLRMKNGQ